MPESVTSIGRRKLTSTKLERAGTALEGQQTRHSKTRTRFEPFEQRAVLCDLQESVFERGGPRAAAAGRGSFFAGALFQKQSDLYENVIEALALGKVGYGDAAQTPHVKVPTLNKIMKDLEEGSLMMSGKFWMDSDVLIRAKNEHYAFDIAPGFWEIIKRSAQGGRFAVRLRFAMKSPGAVMNFPSGPTENGIPICSSSQTRTSRISTRRSQSMSKRTTRQRRPSSF